MASNLAVLLGAPDTDPNSDISFLNISSVEVNSLLVRNSSI